MVYQPVVVDRVGTPQRSDPGGILGHPTQGRVRTRQVAPWLKHRFPRNNPVAVAELHLMADPLASGIPELPALLIGPVEFPVSALAYVERAPGAIREQPIAHLLAGGVPPPGVEFPGSVTLHHLVDRVHSLQIVVGAIQARQLSREPIT